MPALKVLNADEHEAEEYRPVTEMIKANERAHQNLRRIVLHTIAQNLTGAGDQQYALDLLHAYNGLPRLG